MKQQDLDIEPMGDSGGHCDCCGNETRSIWGNAHAVGGTVAAYFVAWTRGQPDHYPNIDLLIGSWGNDAVNDRRLVAWLYNPAQPSFMVVDAAARPAAASALCAMALSRAEALSDEGLMDTARALLDAIWLRDPRVAEVRNLADAT